MTRITPQLIKSLITRNGTLYVPETITNAIGSCVVSDADAVKQEGDRLKRVYDSYETKMEPMKIDYSGDATIDAYTVYYLPRNSVVPRVALLCCAYNKAFQSLPDRLKVLDLGSGTGGVVLGLLDLFHTEALSPVHLEIFALDASLEALNRQEQLVDHMGLGDQPVYCWQVDLSNPQTYKGLLSVLAPFDIVFAANILTELEPEAIDALLKDVAPLLSENGILITVEAQRNYVMRERARMAKNAEGLGLHIYYPCPPGLTCGKQRCWMWRTDEFECPDITVGGETIESTNVQIANWMILSKKSCSIYNVLQEKNPQLIWGVAAPYRPKVEGDKVKHGYEFCTENGWRSGTITQDAKDWQWSLQTELFKRGTVVGIASSFEKIEEGWDIVSGFVSY